MESTGMWARPAYGGSRSPYSVNFGRMQLHRATIDKKKLKDRNKLAFGEPGQSLFCTVRSSFNSTKFKYNSRCHLMKKRALSECKT